MDVTVQHVAAFGCGVVLVSIFWLGNYLEGVIIERQNWHKQQSQEVKRSSTRQQKRQ
jgi:hypothetical protein